MTALTLCVIICAAASFLTWLLSVITKDYSQVDRIWSIIPAVYVWVFAGYAGLHDARLDVMAVLVTLWGARLTFNFARKGGYRLGQARHRACLPPIVTAVTCDQ